MFGACSNFWLEQGITLARLRPSVGTGSNSVLEPLWCYSDISCKYIKQWPIWDLGNVLLPTIQISMYLVHQSQVQAGTACVFVWAGGVQEFANKIQGSLYKVPPSLSSAQYLMVPRSFFYPSSCKKLATVITLLYHALLNCGCICKTIQQEEREKGGGEKQRVWSKFLGSTALPNGEDGSPSSGCWLLRHHSCHCGYHLEIARGLRHTRMEKKERKNGVFSYSPSVLGAHFPYSNQSQAASPGALYVCDLIDAQFQASGCVTFRTLIRGVGGEVNSILVFVVPRILVFFIELLLLYRVYSPQVAVLCILSRSNRYIQQERQWWCVNSTYMEPESPICWVFIEYFLFHRH